MSNFARVIHIALRHRLTVAASVVCSMGVALLWACNLAVVMPIVDGVMQEKTIPELCREWITAEEDRLVVLEHEAESFSKALVDVEVGTQDERNLREKLASTHEKIADQPYWLGPCRAVMPTLERWLPVTPFGTLVMICVALAVSTLVKSLLRIAVLFFMARLGHLTSFELRKGVLPPHAGARHGDFWPVGQG